MPITANDKLLLHMPGPPPPGWLDAVAKRFPQLHVRWEPCQVLDSDLANADTLSDDIWEGVTMFAAYPPPSASRMKDVRWVQVISSGWDRWLQHERFLNPEVVFSSTSGCQPPQIAEWVISTWLAHTHHLGHYAEQQKNENWSVAVRTHPTTDSVSLRMGVLGYGTIGRQCARLGQALGMEIYAYTSSPRTTPESRRLRGYTVPNTGDPDGLIPAKWFSGKGADAVNDFVGQDLDILVLALPGSPETKGLIGREQFQIMGKKKTFLSNIARGHIVDTDALVEALEQGTIRGAALDVTEPEPLPKGHPLWKSPNVFITPHISWQSTTMVSRVADIVMENLERLDKGEPLLNQVKKN